ncbi:MAG: cysteine desulfurase NifS [Oscillospiraceae bacterium]|jgi:cysteine desulfurase|nr:cysteine desulfurase NifS [Oscillospiraceae bacterium]
MSHIVYADNAATTPVSDLVLNSMLPYHSNFYGNPSSLYKIGREAKKAVEQSREQVAGCLGALSNEIFFTSGGSEANNWAIRGIGYNLAKQGKKHIIASAFEHHSVLNILDVLKKDGFEITYLNVYKEGIIRPEDLKNAIRPDTALVTIMYANNEIGTIQPIQEIGNICKEYSIIFHTDAVQAVGNIPIDVKSLNIDLLSLSAHKLHGPKGIGALYIKKGTKILNLIEGGAQERGKRAGTENTAGIIGLSIALKDACDHIKERTKKLSLMRDRLIDGALKIEYSSLNGDRKNRLPGNVSMCFNGIEGESLLLKLDAMGICASSGSACTSGSLDPSHVLLAIGLPHEVAHGSLRLTLSDQNTEEDVSYILECLPLIVKELRDISPLWEKIINKKVKSF